jgi:hypothetical protein
MMNLRKFTFILLFLSVAALPAFSQTDVGVQAIATKVATYNAGHPAEKVYVHFDKPYYAVGDTIWYKAYVTLDMLDTPRANTPIKTLHKFSPLSKVVYVDIISGADSIVQRFKLPVNGGVAFGDIMLNKPLYREGNYRVRAYTNWMRNFDPAYFFNKTIPVGDIADKTVNTFITLNGSLKSGTAKVDAAIHYKTADGRAYTGRKVTWNVQNSDDETVSKGKGTTDNMGNITIAFSTNKTDGLKSAVLITSIDIGGKTVTNSFTLKHAMAPTDVQFFPEGGDLINSIKSKVAFKAVRPDGLGANVKGTVTDNAGAVVANITAQHLGMGVFDLLPESGKTYKANVTFADGTQNTYELPKAKDDGVTLSIVNNEPDRIIFSFASSDAFLLANKGKMIGIIGQNGQIICYGAQTPAAKTYTAAIPKSKFPTGLNKITIFAPNGDPLAERVFFIQHNDGLNINVATAKPSYGPRQKVTFNVTAKKITQQPSEANLSIAVIDEASVPFDENAETTILTSLLLTSDLKGYIEKPNYYFNHANDKTNEDLDVLMLTQGYTRFLYKDLLVNKLPEIKFLPEDGIEVTGTLRTANGMPVSNGVVNLSIKDRHIALRALSNTVGEFRFSKLFFPDSVEASIDARGNYNSAGSLILLNNSAAQPLTPNVTAPDEITNIDTVLTAYLQNGKKQLLNSHVLKEVVVKAAVYEKKPSHEDYPALMGLSNITDQDIQGKNLIGCTNLAECLKTMTTGLVYDDNNLYIRRSHTVGNSNDPAVAIYMNDLPVDFNYLSGVKPEDVESIEVFYSDGLSSINKNTNTNGILVVNSKKIVKVKMSMEEKKAVLADIQNSATKFKPKGYNMARAFYNPRYDPASTSPLGDDLRSTIYWNPKVITDKTGNATFEYFNADTKGTYRAIIEGIDNDGNVGRTVYRYKVQ